jgi:transcriptional regulator with XRE-family HTH domain
MYAPLADHSYRAFVVHLVQLRRAAGITQRQLAARLGLGQSIVAKAERFERRIDPAEFWKWCAALDLDAGREFAAVVAQLQAEETAS